MNCFWPSFGVAESVYGDQRAHTSASDAAESVFMEPIHEVETLLYNELQQVREAERRLTAEFARLPFDPRPTSSIHRFLTRLDETDRRLDRLEFLLEILDPSATVNA